MDSLLQERADGGRLVGAWLLLALTALALSTLCAVLLVFARAPLLPGGFSGMGELFGRALVLHVSLAVIVWFLACAAGFWTLVSGAPASIWRWAAFALAGLGLASMAAALVFGNAQPVLANYVPVLDQPVFLAGLVLFILGVAVSGALALPGIVRQIGRDRDMGLGALLSIVATAMALGALAVSLAVTGRPGTPAAFEILAWGPGHVLQFVHVILLMTVWSLLVRDLPGKPVAPRWMAVLLALAAAPLVTVPFLYQSHPSSIEFRHAFTLLMAWGAWPAAALLGCRLLLQLGRAVRTAWSAPHVLPLLLSILLFLLGCLLGAAIRGDSTMVPAHYHGTVGAVTMAYMALGYRLLAAFGYAGPAGRLQRWQPLLYGSGLLILALGLAWSGWLGVPRKTLHADVILRYPAYFAAMGMAGLGGFLGIGGAALFVANIVRSLWRQGPANTSKGGRRRDVRMPAFIVTVLLTAAIGLLITYWPRDLGTVQKVDAAREPVGHATQKRNEEIDRHFKEGVALLKEKQYEAAAGQLHRVVSLAPRMPEAHVNLGFAMIGLQRYEQARRAFENAIDLRTRQINAYYGLAMALEALQDLPGALGAMRSYVHLSTPDDPYVRKANAAIWEWETQLQQGASPGVLDTAAIPENEKRRAVPPIREKKLGE
ncbi:MAG TPA: hypothetical protein DHV59_08805 [Oxalobacteraceae bacterium]|nr:hypothetical protein [Oxalobacteraceae bacterium]